MEELYYSKTKHEVPLSNYEIIRERVPNPTGFRSTNRRDTVKPGTFLGFTDKDGNEIDINEYYTKKKE